MLAVARTPHLRGNQVNAHVVAAPAPHREDRVRLEDHEVVAPRRQSRDRRVVADDDGVLGRVVVRLRHLREEEHVAPVAVHPLRRVGAAALLRARQPDPLLMPADERRIRWPRPIGGDAVAKRPLRVVVRVTRLPVVERRHVEEVGAARVRRRCRRIRPVDALLVAVCVVVNPRQGDPLGVPGRMHVHDVRGHPLELAVVVGVVVGVGALCKHPAGRLGDLAIRPRPGRRDPHLVEAAAIPAQEGVAAVLHVPHRNDEGVVHLHRVGRPVPRRVVA